MSDGSLSQAEIDALLQGVPEFGSKSTENKEEGGAVASGVKDSFASIPPKFHDDYVKNLEMLTGVPVEVKSVELDEVNNVSILSKVPEEVVCFEATYSGFNRHTHLYLLSTRTAQVLAEKMMGQTLDGISEATISAIGESINMLNSVVVSKMEAEGVSLGAEVISGKLTSARAMGLPDGSLMVVSYDLKINGFDDGKLYEVFALPLVEVMLKKTSMASAPKKSPLEDMLSMNSQPSPIDTPYSSVRNATAAQQVGAVQPAVFSGLTDASAMGIAGEPSNISLLMDVFMELTVELGRSKRLIKDILQMGDGTIIALDKLAGEPVDVLVNHKLIAKGEVVVIDENFGVRITEVISPMERVSDIM